ncbi:unnamed protein product [Cylindrotheca closterium]|uniref:Serine aminopeptidase S33 domain-containing protein n=1 Tax=Cylindrotheca closterium TaxID=2856 RepID=A0AAD2CWQ3_9STRA|nr:unnamed protein product [Cylindrotheca closterium]
MTIIKHSQRTVFGSKVTIEIDDDCFPTDKEIETMDVNLPGCQHDYFESKSHGGAKLHYRYWLPPKGNVKGVAVFFHGINSHSGRGFVVDGRKLSFSLMTEQFLNQGIALYLMDQYGHGFSEGSRFLIKKWEMNKQDCIDFANFIAEKYSADSKKKAPPLFIAGESFGGCMAIHTSKYCQDTADTSPAGKLFDSMLLTAPAIHADLPGFPVYQILRYIIAPLMPTKRPFFMPHPIPPERIWRDQRAMEFFTSPQNEKWGLEEAGKKLRLGTALGCVVAMENACNHVIPEFSVPFCIIHGTQDDGVPIAGSEFMMETCQTLEEDKELHAMDGARHEVFCDPLAEEAIGHWMKFLKKRLDKQS